MLLYTEEKTWSWEEVKQQAVVQTHVEPSLTQPVQLRRISRGETKNQSLWQ